MNVSVVTAIRRFDIPDLDRYGHWFVPRLLKAYPHLNERSLVGWLRTIVYSNEFMFLCQDHSVALAQCMAAHTLSPKPVIEERFVFVENSDNKEQLAAASGFYDHFARWAKHHGAEVVTIMEMSDVPQELLKLGRVFIRQQHFARI